MPSERQQSANRRNAASSTGPRSRAGKVRSSQNARSHGLSLPSQVHASWSDKVEALAQLLAGMDLSDTIRVETARVAAGAHFDAVRARHARAALIEKFLVAPEAEDVPMPA